MGCRVGDMTPCNPYLDHRAAVVESPPPQPQFSSSATSTPSTKSMSARDKLLNVIRQPKESDLLTDTEISGKKKKDKSESVVTISNGNHSQSINSFSNKTGLELLAKLKPTSPSQGDSIESKVSFSSREKNDGTTVASASGRINGSTSPSKTSLSLSPLTLRTNDSNDDGSELMTSNGTLSDSPSSTNLPPAMMSEQQPSQSLLHPGYPYPHAHPQMQPHPGMMMMYPPNMPIPYPGYPMMPPMGYPVPPYPVAPYSQPLRGSPYDPTPSHLHPPPIQNRTSPSNIHHASHGYPLPSEGAVSYLMSRFGKPHNHNIHDPGR